ncbi:MAG: ChbG/HpnK family deacetylase [bacterium]
MKENRYIFIKLVLVIVIFITFLPVVLTIGADIVKIPGNEIWLLVRGDDIGFAHGANMAFIKSFQDGILSSAELMVPPGWFNEGVKILKENPELEAGVHLTLTSEWFNYRWGPVGPIGKNSTIVDEDGYFFQRTEKNSIFEKLFNTNYCFVESDFNLKEVETELRAQIEKAIKKIPRINHISCHMGAAVATPELKNLVGELAEEYGLVPDWKIRDIAEGVSLWSVPVEEKIDSLLYHLQHMQPGQLYYLVVHPGINTPEMRAVNSPGYEADVHMAEHRAAVTEMLTHPKVRGFIKKRNIKIVNHQYIIDKALLCN